ncbi:MAG: Hsp20/alpha crystallin family protein [Kofleriaceae bacterium]
MATQGQKDETTKTEQRTAAQTDDRSKSSTSLGRPQQSGIGRSANRYGTSMSNPFSTSFSPFAMMRRMFDDMERLMDVFGSSFDRDLEPSLMNQRGMSGFAFAPRVDVARKDGQFVITAELPGVSMEDVHVSIDDNAVVIEGERKFENEYTRDDVWRSERMRGQFQRVIPLPESVEVESAEARLDNGILSIKLRERDQGRRGRQLEIKQGPGEQKTKTTH